MKLDLSAYNLDAIKRAAKILADANITEEQVAEMADISGEILRARNLFTQGLTEMYVNDDPTELACVYYTFRLNISEDDAADIYFELVKKLVTKFQILPTALHFSFRPLQ